MPRRKKIVTTAAPEPPKPAVINTMGVKDKNLISAPWAEVFSTETMYEEPIEPGSLLAKYPPKRKQAAYVHIWKELLEDVATRPNFKYTHLLQLEILCGLFLEHDRLSRYLEKVGYTFQKQKESRYGDIVRPWPEVALLQRVRSEISSYSKLLGILIFKDTKLKENNESEQW
jgi:hypothetical protein